MPATWRDIRRIWLAPASDAAHRRQALLIGAEPAIGGAAEATTVIGAPRSILRLRWRSNCGGDDQQTEERKCGFHDYALRIHSQPQRPIVN